MVITSQQKIYGLYLLFFLIGIFSLDNFFTVWYDETYYAEIAYQAVSGNGLINKCDLFTYSEGQQIHGQGFVYLMLTGISIWFAGLSPFSFRLVNYLAYFILVVLLGERFGKNKPLAFTVVFVIALFCENNGFTNAFTGRMESLALLFTVIAYTLYLKNDRPYKPYLIGIITTLALLTTVRSFFLFIPMAWLLASDLFKSDHWKQSLKTGGTILLTVFTWIQFSFGSVTEFYRFYFQNTTLVDGELTLFEQFVSFDNLLLTNKLKIALYVILLLSFLLPKAVPEKHKPTVRIYSIVSFIFLIIIKDEGSYFALVSPLIMYCIFTNIYYSNFRLKKAFLVAVLVFNVSLLSLKYFNNMTSDYRDSSVISEMVNQSIPENSNVISAFCTYYALREKNRNMYYLHMGGKSPEMRINYLIENTDPQYLITLIGDPLLSHFEKRFNCEIMAKYPEKNSTRSRLKDWELGNFFNLDYQGLCIFKLNKKLDDNAISSKEFKR